MAFDKFSLQGKTALITGAGGLLGGEHTEALLENGAVVVITDVSEESISRLRHRLLARQFASESIITRVMDVTNFLSINDTAESLVKDKVRVDILVNNAAIDPKFKGREGLIETSRFETFSLGNWNQEISVGLTGAFLCSQIFGARMAKDGRGGVILNIASDLSVISPDQRIYVKDGLPADMQPVKPVTYSVIKSGLIGLTRYVATYWADKGVRCNALSPGGVFTGQDGVFVERLSSLIPLGRMATKDEYKAAVQFLCSEGSSYMTGQNILMDGGRSIL